MTIKIGRLLLSALIAAPPAIAQFNPPDCAYPDATPAVSSVNGDGVGPWVSAAVHLLTINSLPDQQVPNPAYSASATTAPFSVKTINRHFGFGATAGKVTIGGVTAAVTSWSDTQITAIVPTGVPNCAIQQQAQYGGSTAQCGQVVITAANGQHSIDAVTVAIGGKAPTHVTGTIQSAIDAAEPGDLIMVPAGTYNEMVIMWKPVRLQGVGAASTVINATPSATALGAWQRQVDCLFGVALNGLPISATNPYAPSGTYTCPASMQFQVDRLPFEQIFSDDLDQTTPNPLPGHEGAGITVLGKGVKFPAGSNPFASAGFPTGTLLLSAADCGNVGAANPYPSNFNCNPSDIDGLSIIDSSQGGGGIFAHAWAHNIEIANNRIHNNHGGLAGGIGVGLGRSAPAYIQGNPSNRPPGSCFAGRFANQQLPYCFNLNHSVHNNAVTLNSSIGDELSSGELMGAGGVAFCSGADFYKFNFNWVCGNQGPGDGGGVGHRGFIWNGDIEHNTIVFNQGYSGGALKVMGAGSSESDGLSNGVGPGLVINANLVTGNYASGSGGGVRLQSVNGTEVQRFPSEPFNWYAVFFVNNIIANNVAGWDGAGVSLQDAFAVNLINNTIASNDSIASAPALFPGVSPGVASLPQPAGLVSLPNSATMQTAVAGTTLVCPPNHSGCAGFSNPYLANNLLWQNRSFYISVGAYNSLSQQYAVTLDNAFSGTAAALQSATGACVSGSSYWEIGVRGDTAPSNHSSGFTLAPNYSLLTDATDYPGANNVGSNPGFVSQYCNGARIPPEFAVAPPFGLAPFAPVDDGKLMINLAWGPLSLTNPTVTGAGGNYGGGTVLGNYAPTAGSPVVDYVPSTSPTFAVAPTTDFFGNPRPDPASRSRIDIGAVEFQGAARATLTSISPSSGSQGGVVHVTFTGTNLTGATAVSMSGTGITVSALTVVNPTAVTATLTILPTASPTARTVTVTTPGGTSNAVTFTVTAPTLTASPAALSFGFSVSRDVFTTLDPQTVSVNTTGSALPVTVSATTTSGGAWLSVSPSTGATPLTLTVGAFGPPCCATYSGTVSIFAPGASNSTLIIPVTFTVGF